MLSLHDAVVLPVGLSMSSEACWPSSLLLSETCRRWTTSTRVYRFLCSSALRLIP